MVIQSNQVWVYGAAPDSFIDLSLIVILHSVTWTMAPAQNTVQSNIHVHPGLRRP